MFNTTNFVEGQSVDLKNEIILANPVALPFSTFALNKTVKADSATVKWIQEEIADSAVTMAEGGDAPAYKKDNAGLLENYLEIIGNTVTVSNTAQASSAVGINDLFLREIDKKIVATKRKTENVLLYGEKGFVNSTYKTDGIFNLVNEEHRVVGDITLASFNETISRLYDAGVGHEMLAFMNAHTKQILNGYADDVVYLGKDKQYGFDIASYSTAFGMVSFVDVPMMKKGDLVVLNPNYIETPELMKLNVKPEPSSGSKKSAYMEQQLGLKLLNSKAAATLRPETEENGE
ncbi:DUF5309 family protein [Alkalihalobacillus sp. 1P02AB]|uniref:SU10 major capsid protein n=1 Tax=Alkalihalobacillus sp. 1P02AB TaxID=3132260 RepID=UPI0039A41ECF